MAPDVKRICAAVLARLSRVGREGPLSCLLCGLLASGGGYLFAPLGPAAVSAAWLMGRPGIWELGGAALGSLICGRWAALMNLSMLSALRLLSESRRMRSRLRDKLILTLCAGLLCAPFFYISSPVTALTGAAHICLTLIFSAVFCRSGRALRRARMGRGIGDEDMAALLISSGAICCAGSAIGYGGVSLGSILAAAVAVFSTGFAGIYSVAAAALSAAGTVLGGCEPAFVGALSLGALAAAALSSLGRLPACMAFAIVCALWGYWAECLLQLALPGTVAALGCALLPQEYHDALKNSFRLGKSEAEQRLSALTGRVMDAALVLDRVSALFEHSPESEAELFAGRQLRCMSEAMTSLPRRSRKKHYSLDCGMASCPRMGSSETGDSMSLRELVGGKLALLSDGMGSGPTARRESSTAVSLIGDLLSVGVEELDALDCVNRLLMAKGERDMYATLDAMSFNYHSGCARFLKLGAPPSYVLRRDQVIELCAETLPIGIVSGAQPACEEMQLCPGDMVFMLSDGVTDALEDQLIPHIAACAGLSPREAASGLIQAAKGLSMADDMSAIVLQVLKCY